MRAGLRIIAAAGLCTACASLPAPPPTLSSDGSVRITSLEPGLVDGLLVVRFELTNHGEVPIHLVDGLVPPASSSEAVIDPLVVVTPTLDGVTVVRKGGLPSSERRFFLSANVPVLTAVEPGERFSDTVRVIPPSGDVHAVRLRVEYATGVAASPVDSAVGRVLTAPYEAVFAARRVVESEPVGVPSALDIRFD